METLPDYIRENDARLHLSLGNILDATPPHFLHLRDYHFCKSMVTNGEYLQFLNTADPEGVAPLIFDRHDLWQFVWGGMGFGINAVRTPYERVLGEIEIYQENYAGCSNFVDAYLLSVRYEIDRCMQAMAVIDPKGSEERAQSIERLFACIRYKLGGSIIGQFNSPADFLTGPEMEALQGYSEIKQVVADIDAIVAVCKQIFRRRIDRQFLQAFEMDAHPVECLSFLWRVKDQLKKPNHNLQSDLISLRSVLFPRYWPTDQGKVGIEGMAQFRWRDQPVMGVSLHESLAFCMFLQFMAQVNATLPSEAEYERAASWPLGNGISEQPHVVDPCLKAVYPWQEHNRQEFNFFFGMEGKSLAALANSKPQYVKVREDTRREVELPSGARDSIYDLTGFGWQWTVDRYEENERKYGRFNNPLYARYAVPCVDTSGTQIDVFDYQQNMDTNDSYMVLRGAPEVIGGPGLTTRRFAGYPLRGYRNVGFRWTIKDE